MNFIEAIFGVFICSLLILLVFFTIKYLSEVLPSGTKKSNSISSPPIIEAPSIPIYKGKKYLMTNRELRYYKKYQASALQRGLIVFTKVRLADIIEPIKSRDNWYTAFNRIKSKHIDFVICNAETGEIVKCIEINDASHRSAKRRERDKFVLASLEEAGVELEFIN